MESSYFKYFVFLGICPDRPVNRLRVILNCFLLACIGVLSGYKAYIDKDLEVVERINGLLIVTVKYLGLTFGKKPIKRMLEAMENFWNTEDQVTYYSQYVKWVELIYRGVIIFVFVTHVLGPFFIKGTSIFSCYIPSNIPFPLFYSFEFYAIMLASSLTFYFNVFVCSLISSVAAQFKLVNLKIADLNVMEVRNNHDLKTYKSGLKYIIEHQQFLMSFVEDLNELLSVPIAILMATNIPMICISMYVRTIHQGSIIEECRFMLIIFIIITEFFVIYGLPAQLLMDESEIVADTLYFECKWYSPELRALRNDFLIMMMRGQKGVSIRAGNYHVINNRTILLIMKTAYSFNAFLQKVT